MILLLLLGNFARGQQGRVELGLNRGWLFTRDSHSVSDQSGAGWKRVDVPHTWNAEDVNDDMPGFYRGVCWYKKQLFIEPELKAKKLTLAFDGVNQVAEVYVNGKFAGTHKGGYTRFCFPVDGLIDFNPGAVNSIMVKVDNTFDANIPPLSGDFTFFGGIYRDVKLIVNDPVHFAFDNGTSHVYISTPNVSAKQASVQVKSRVQNQSLAPKKLVVCTTIKDAEGKVVVTKNTNVQVKPNAAANVSQLIDNIANPQLWSPELPYLYTVITKIQDAKSGTVLDQVSNPLGFRWFRFDAKTGFYLNDKPYKLIGASRHQDFKALGNAVPKNYHWNDVRLLKDMGANFLRVAHYPQDPAVLEACDKLGLLTSVEIPIVSTITETEAFDRQCKEMQVEMIRQHFNHPSVIIWAYMNEILLEPKYTGQPERKQQYIDHITRLAEQLEALTRAEDPSRYTLIPNHAWYDDYRKARLTDIPMIVGWNLYQGWYGGNTSQFAEFLDRFHNDYPNKPVMVTEYGADADPRIRATNPEAFDKSMEYALNFHDTYLAAINQRPFVAAGMIWNLADFSSEARSETMPHVNNKGMLRMDRKPKDLYYFYQAHLLKTPFVSISGWRKRSGCAGADGVACVQALDVFSNAPSMELFHEGKSLGVRTPENGRFTWQVPFQHGANSIEAVIRNGGMEYKDKAVVDFEIINNTLSGIQESPQMNVLLGSKRMFEDDCGQVWLPGQEYVPGKWGHVMGKPFALQNALQKYGTNKNIRETDNDPVYQTQLVGIKEYRLDVADGMYDLVLHFAELTETAKTKDLAYNLSGSTHESRAEERVFHILVNGNPVYRNFNIAQRYGVLTAGFESVKVMAENGGGIRVEFVPVVGQPVLNALQLRRLH